jgi:multicomponent K+:H+ antiporter subunit D
VYLLGDWPSRLGIALMVDRLSAWMLLVTTLLAIASLLHACAGWDRRAPHFHAFFQFQLMGLNGAFLTGDIFNLFVFFEVMLIASYGLLLSAGRGLRMRVGFHYVVFNVTASTLFLIALGLLYGLLGSLNMAELAVRMANVPPENLRLVQATCGLLLLVFCAKAALLPLYLWLPDTYARAPAAVAALFAVMTKVGLYAVLRVGSLWFGEEAGAMAGFASDWLLVLGWARWCWRRWACWRPRAARIDCLPGAGVGGDAVHRLLAGQRGHDWRGPVLPGAQHLRHRRAVPAGRPDPPPSRRASDRKEMIAPMPGKTGPGLLFLVAAISLAGLPPLSGFIGKLLLLEAVPAGPRTFWVWLLVLGTSFMMLVGLARAGTRLFWRVAPWPDAGQHRLEAFTPEHEMVPAPSRPLETAAIVLLLAYGVALVVAAAPVLDYTRATALQLLSPGDYVEHVRAALPILREP